tara:strand:+ start:1254 stop:1835 length:582 start_codon:yes stop_codon:yes gene_type:complete
MADITKEYIKQTINDSIETKKNLLDQKLLDSIEIAALKTISIIKEEGKTIFAGNGGSAADSQHLAAEFVSRFEFDRPGLPSIALSTDTSMITAISNDYGYEKLFERQLQANSSSKDIFFGISTSGKSKNIIKAFEYCKKNNIYSVALTGADGMENVEPDLQIKVPSRKTARIQECHITIGHIICGLVERSIFS